MGPAGRHGEEWFTELYAAHYAHIVKYGLRRLTGADAAAELAQEVFTVAWRRRDDVPAAALPWLYGVARRLLANHRRAATATPVADPDVFGAVQQADDEIVAASDIRAALATLAEIDREILQLIGWEQLTLAEAAQSLGCTRATATVRLHRARKRLGAALAARAAYPALPSYRKVS
jgi:RNA polymerase sigma-70 factor (ECF subfamily)